MVLIGDKGKRSRGRVTKYAFSAMRGERSDAVLFHVECDDHSSVVLNLQELKEAAKLEAVVRRAQRAERNAN